MKSAKSFSNESFVMGLWVSGKSWKGVRKLKTGVAWYKRNMRLTIE